LPICRELYSPSIDAYVDEKKRDLLMDPRDILTPSIESVYDDSNANYDSATNDNESLTSA
jgi:hypothetical protein